MFNTKEIAYLIWGTVALALILLSKGVRRPFVGLLRTLFTRKFLYVYLIALSYVGLSVLILSKANLWDQALIKDTIMWVLFIACPLMYKAARIKDFNNFVKEIVRPLTAISVVFEFVVGLYTFDLWIELAMVPVLVCIAGMLAVAEGKADTVKVQKLLKGVLSFIGILSLIAVGIHLGAHYKEYINWLTLMQFLLPLLLSLLFLPFLYGLSMFTHYEGAFDLLERHFRDRAIYKYAMLKAMLRFNGDLSGMERWKHLVLSKNLRTRHEIDQSIGLIKTLQRAERDPPAVNEALGWSPYRVKDLLVSKGIETRDYKNTLDKEFGAISLPIELPGNEILSDTITYMVLGEQLVATKLKLSLNVYHGNNSSSSLTELLHCSELLHMGIFNKQFDDDLKTAIIDAKDYNMRTPFADVSVKRIEWENQTKGFSVHFTITHDRHID